MVVMVVSDTPADTAVDMADTPDIKPTKQTYYNI